MAKSIDMGAFHKKLMDKLSDQALTVDRLANYLEVPGLRPHDVKARVEELAKGNGKYATHGAVMEAVAEHLGINMDELATTSVPEKKGPMGHATRKRATRTRGGPEQLEAED